MQINLKIESQIEKNVILLQLVQVNGTVALRDDIYDSSPQQQCWQYGVHLKHSQLSKIHPHRIKKRQQECKETKLTVIRSSAIESMQWMFNRYPGQHEETTTKDELLKLWQKP